MSFLLDPVLLIETGATIGERVEDDLATIAAGAIALGGFYAISVSLYKDLEWTRPVWRSVGARSGKDWMLNSGVFAFEFRHPSRETDLVSAAIFATYPIWITAGILWGRRRRKALRDMAS